MISTFEDIGFYIIKEKITVTEGCLIVKQFCQLTENVSFKEAKSIFILPIYYKRLISIKSK